jgi:hypothetical protein
MFELQPRGCPPELLFKTFYPAATLRPQNPLNLTSGTTENAMSNEWGYLMREWGKDDYGAGC